MNTSHHFTPPFYQPTATQRGFSYRALKTWNNLSVATRNSRSISQFKKFKKSVKREMETTLIGGLFPKKPLLQSNIPPINLVSN